MSDAKTAGRPGLGPGTADSTVEARRVERASALERARRWGLVVMLAWAPFPLGSARPWAWSLLGVMVLSLLLLSAAAEAIARRASRPLGQLVVPCAFGVVLVFWILLQSLPGGLFGVHHPLWDRVAEGLGTPPVASISVDREASRVHLYRLLIYAAVLWVAWQVGQRRDGATLVVRAVAVAGTFYATYGLVEYSSGNPSILWFPKWTYYGDVTSTFVNRNSFATYAGLCIVANLLVFSNVLINKVDASSRTSIALSTIENLLWRGRWAVVGLAVLGSALLLSHSRAGVMCTLCAVVAFSITVALAPSLRSRPRVNIVFLLAVGSALLFLMSGEGVFVRLVETSSLDEGRMDIAGAMLRAIHDNIWTGSGLGSFTSIYPMYQEVTFDGMMDFAHDDYLENALDLGLPAAFLLFALLAMLVASCIAGIVRRRRDALFACAAVSASILVGAHALFDFSMQIPAVAITYMAILGVGVAQSVSSRPGV